VSFLGHVVSEDGVSTDPEKIVPSKSGQYQMMLGKYDYFSDWKVITGNLYRPSPL